MATTNATAKIAATHRASAPQTRVVLVTGMSGAGHSSARKAFEDMGY